MKAIRVHSFGEPDVLKLEEAPAPTPDAGQVVVRVEAVGVNPVETYIRSGKYGPKKFPFTPGNDAAGVIDALGSGVQHLKAGDRVYTDRTVTGSYAEAALCDVNYVHPLPAKVTFQQGAAVGAPAGAAWRGLFQRGRGLGGETVLIHGATGAVGLSAVQLARAAGMKVIGSASSDKGKKFVLDQGAHHAVGHEITQQPDEVNALTDGKGFDLILEMRADKNLASDLGALAKGGRVVVIGSRGRIEIDPRETMAREADVLGMTIFGATPQEHLAMYSALTAALANQTLRPTVGLELPLSQASRAHQLVIEGDQFGKIVLIP
jgi:NADPH2:quinone reductase